MQADSGELRIARSQLFAGRVFAVQEKLKCPRCESNNTKFCYFNNYNLTQPRHFCRTCRRYWTQGGALRNVPVGGRRRKYHQKRSPSQSNNSSPASSSSCTPPSQQDPPMATGIPLYPISSPPTPATASLRSFNGYGTVQVCSSMFKSAHDSGFMAYNGFRFDDLSVWADSPETVNTGVGGGLHTWPLGVGGDGRGGYGDNFSWPEIKPSISSTVGKV